jgi:hypothetical protein
VSGDEFENRVDGEAWGHGWPGCVCSQRGACSIDLRDSDPAARVDGFVLGEDFGHVKDGGEVDARARERFTTAAVAVHETERADDFRPDVPDRPRGAKEGAGRGDDIVEENDTLSRREMPLDLATGSVLFGRRAHEESPNRVGRPCAPGDRGADDRVCTECWAPDTAGSEADGLPEQGFGGEAGAVRIGGRQAKVQVVVAGHAGGEDEVTAPEGDLADDAEEVLAIAGIEECLLGRWVAHGAAV